ncbi:hypothetical protein H5410_027845 [Solanum commersonii]|uniref:Uncharacterized protein ycf72 n=1 Tax=Solanum commersonii TaxID=4109 RepID=A0A9J5Z0B5_SOLCO|nr:hypothetical protein H5410_027845 [Solanum commersonii]
MGCGVFLPIAALPSPPPWEWSIRFITTPLTIGLLPSQRLDPVVPKLFWYTPTFPTCLTVAEQFLEIKRTSPEVQTTLKGRAFPNFIGTFVPETMEESMRGHQFKSWIFELREIKNSQHFLDSWTQFNSFGSFIYTFPTKNIS